MARKFIQQRKQTKEEMFDAVVKNAIDFIDASLDNLAKRPKNGIVDFYTAIELFLKARLMAEHWALVVSKPEAASLSSFSTGDFHSVSLEDAAKRLKEIVGEPIEESALNNFKALGEHRNQIVHFAHTDYSDLGGVKAGVVIEQWNSWYFMYGLLIGKWNQTFKQYIPEFERLNYRIINEKSFIEARFAELTGLIKEQRSLGKELVECGRCHQNSGLVESVNNWGAAYSCLVCQEKGSFIKRTLDKIECDDCGVEFEFFNSKVKNCQNCHSIIDTDKLISMCKKKYKEGDDWWEEGGPSIAYCHECCYRRPSVFYIDGLWSCVSCFDRGWQAVSCPHCDEFVTGDMELVKYYACCRCEADVQQRELTQTNSEGEFMKF